MKVADGLAALPYVDKDRMGAMGWSWGGYMMMWLEGHTDRFKAARVDDGRLRPARHARRHRGAVVPASGTWAACRGNRPLYEKDSPSSYVKNFKTPCLVITGERDYRVPYTQSLQFFTDLQR